MRLKSAIRLLFAFGIIGSFCFPGAGLQRVQKKPRLGKYPDSCENSSVFNRQS